MVIPWLLDTSNNLLLPDAIDSITLSSVDFFFTPHALIKAAVS